MGPPLGSGAESAGESMGFSVDPDGAVLARRTDHDAARVRYDRPADVRRRRAVAERREERPRIGIEGVRGARVLRAREPGADDDRPPGGGDRAAEEVARLGNGRGQRRERDAGSPIVHDRRTRVLLDVATRNADDDPPAARRDGPPEETVAERGRL